MGWFREKDRPAGPRIDADSGLPKLPEHYYWRVGPKEGYDSTGYDGAIGYGISLRCDLEKKVRWAYRSHVINHDIEKGIKTWADILAQRLYSDLKAAEDKVKFAGEYPPNRMPR